jgi:methionyl-tRNA formyltransferase
VPTPLRIIFCGTPAFAVPSLIALASRPEFKVEGVVTQPDRPSGRGQSLAKSPVKVAAEERGIPVFQPTKIKTPEGLAYITNAKPDVVVIIAYGQIISTQLLAIPRLGWVNVHGSLLPQYRGAAPIHWAVANGETETGLTTMQVEAGLDTGPMLLKYNTSIGADETSLELYERLAQAAAPLIVETLTGLAAGVLAPTPQDNAHATLAPMMKKEDGRIDWSRTSTEIYNHMRGFQPWPGAFTTFRGTQCSLWGKPSFDDVATTGAPGTISLRDREIFVACGGGTSLHVEFVQREGRKRISAREFSNGERITTGESFGG